MQKLIEDRVQSHCDMLSELSNTLAAHKKPSPAFWQKLYERLSESRGVSSVLGIEYMELGWPSCIDSIRQYILDNGVDLEHPDRTFFLLGEIRAKCENALDLVRRNALLTKQAA